MTWLQRYRVRHYLTNSIWIPPLLSMIAALAVHFVLAIVFALPTASRAAEPKQPNIILMLADDQAWAGTSVAMHPDVLLFDEPFSALDDDTRHEMYDLFRSIRKQMPVTVLHVTHNRDEAARLGDCFFQLRDGRIREVPR